MYVTKNVYIKGNDIDTVMKFSVRLASTATDYIHDENKFTTIHQENNKLTLGWANGNFNNGRNFNAYHYI